MDIGFPWATRCPVCTFSGLVLDWPFCNIRSRRTQGPAVLFKSREQVWACRLHTYTISNVSNVPKQKGSWAKRWYRRSAHSCFHANGVLLPSESADWNLACLSSPSSLSLFLWFASIIYLLHQSVSAVHIKHELTSPHSLGDTGNQTMAH